MSLPEKVRIFPAVTGIARGADHIDVKVIEGYAPMKAFIAGMIGYQPAWITFLYGVRWFFVRLLGMKQPGIPRPHGRQPETVPMTSGEKLSFFEVKVAEDEQFWVAGITESHLTAHLGVVVEHLGNGRRRYYVLTMVHYHHWTGPVYFNAIRPFHHLVVGSMIKGGMAA